MATQKPELRAKFEGKPEHVMAFLLFVAQDVREHLAQMGYRTLDEVIGRSDLLARRTDIKEPAPAAARRRAEPARARGLSRGAHAAGGGHAQAAAPSLNEQIAARCAPGHGRGLEGTVALHHPQPGPQHRRAAWRARSPAKYMDDGAAGRHIEVDFRGYAGQSFGAFTTNGMRLHLVGAGQRLCGQGHARRRDLHPPVPRRRGTTGTTTTSWATRRSTAPRAARCSPRAAPASASPCATPARAAWSKAWATTRCEYMTGGVVVVLGQTGRNFAAGMTGGVAYVYDNHDLLSTRANAHFVSGAASSGSRMQAQSRASARTPSGAHRQPARPRASWTTGRISFRSSACLSPAEQVAALEAANEGVTEERGEGVAVGGVGVW